MMDGSEKNLAKGKQGKNSQLSRSSLSFFFKTSGIFLLWHFDCLNSNSDAPQPGFYPAQRQ